jgi:cardiolipin synthase
MHANGRNTTKLTRGLALFGAGALVLHGWRLGLTLLGPPKKYRVNPDRLPPVDSDQLRDYISNMTDAQAHADTRVSVLTNGDAFYPAEIAAIRAARHSVNLEAYEFHRGEITRQFLDALVDRAHAGVEVRMVIDAIGSWGTGSAYFDGLREAGGRFEWYHPIDSRTWPYFNNRTHRKLLVVDGEVGFVGGAGFADQWVRPNAYGPPWRDTVFQVEGGVVAGLNAVFAENWLETTGEILAGTANFQFAPADGGVSSMVVASTPRSGTTRARILYQALIESAQKEIHITTPYFVPDRSARRALERAARQRGVRVQILTTGPHNDHAMTRQLSHLLDSGLLKAGAQVYEYQPSMIHAKLMTIDGLWTVAGSTNFDHRSFDLNDEVNIVMFDRAIASRIDQDFAHDLSQSRELTLAHLRKADLVDRVVGETSWILRREQ